MTPEEIKRRLQETLSPDQLKLIEIVGTQAEQMGVNVYLVGGFVRDLIMGRKNMDFDFVVEGNAIQFVGTLRKLYGSDLFAYPQFGTATWLLDKENALRLAINIDQDTITLDFASARREAYERPGALPTIYTDSIGISQDLKRRDFTINAMAIQLSSFDLVDPYGGKADIEHCIIRVLHKQSFFDDPTRIFRAFRYEQRFGFTVESETEALISPALPLIKHEISGERLRHEIDLILKEAVAEKVLIRLDELNVLRSVHSELQANAWLVNAFGTLRQIVVDHEKAADTLFRISGPYFFWPVLAYPVEHLDSLFEKLPFEARIIDSIQQTRRAVAFVDNTLELPVSQFIREIGPLDNFFAQYAAWAIASLRNSETRLANYKQWTNVKPHLTGDDLKKMGLQPGPLFGKLLRQLRDDLLDGKITHDGERARVLELIAQWKTPD